MHRKSFYIYIITNTANTVLYTGVTSNLIQRIWQHREKLVPGFSANYSLWKLIYYEQCDDGITAFEREKQIKDMRRERKINLIEQMNPEWKDLYPKLNK
jgi:putative endonuclease